MFNYKSVFTYCQVQRGGLVIVNELMNEGIKDKLEFISPCSDSSNICTFRIADFGCSVGPNTFLAMEKIIEAVEQKYHAQFQNSPVPLEFQVFFNDVTTNDFNTLFKTLPFYQKYFAAGVPGTFYGRLFPKSTLHLAYSSYSLQWLSKVPEEVVDTKSPAWNKGIIQCSGTAKEVAKAYSAQFKTDMDNFLNARAQEIIGGGLMVIIILGLPDGILLSQTVAGKSYELFGSCLIDMAKLVSI
jgi:indole-3-acetate O-methyltransferase